jgi:hypothetical protein
MDDAAAIAAIRLSVEVGDFEINNEYRDESARPTIRLHRIHPRRVSGVAHRADAPE